MTTKPQSYRPAQIILHWVVVIGIIVQWAEHDQMVRVVEATQSGGPPVGSDVTMA